MNRKLPWLLAWCCVLAACYRVPQTGRSALILPIVDDVARGSKAFIELKAKGAVSTDAQFNERVQRVGRRIAEAVGQDLPDAHWEFVVFDETKTVNAFALPGGKVGVSTGLLLVTDNDDQLAAVMGHEIAHATARHGAQRITEATLVILGGVVSANAAVLVGYGLAASGTVLTFSRAHEREADFIGLRYAAKAGYDPRAAVDFWRKMADESERSGLSFLVRTHPLTVTRIADLLKWMPEVLPLYEAARQRQP